MAWAAAASQAAATALSAIEYFAGSTTTTNSNTQASSSGTTASQTAGESVSSADPAILAMMKSLAGTAIDNANNAGKIDNGIISSFLKQATDAMTQVFGQQNQSGIYSGATAQVINNDTMARASADAVAAINTYQTGQQGVATNALQDLLTATATQTSTGSASGQTSSDSTSNTKSTSKTKASLICTWMFKNGLLPREQYIAVTRDFKKRGWKVQTAYVQFATPLVIELNRDRTSLLSRATLALFTSRTQWVCARAGVAGLEMKISGQLARAAVWSLVLPFYLRLVFSYTAGHILTRYSHILRE